MKTLALTIFIFTSMLFAGDANTTLINNYIDKVADTTKKIVKSTAHEFQDFKEASSKEIHKLTKETKEATQDVIKESKSVKLIDKNSTLIPSKESIKKFYKVTKSKVNDLFLHTTLKHALHTNKNIHSTIYININNAHVELFGKVKSREEEQKAIDIASSIKGVLSVESALLVEE